MKRKYEIIEYSLELPDPHHEDWDEDRLIKEFGCADDPNGVSRATFRDKSDAEKYFKSGKLYSFRHNGRIAYNVFCLMEVVVDEAGEEVDWSEIDYRVKPFTYENN